jgi:hypothetical protein
VDVFALTMRLKEEGAAQVKASTDRLGDSFDATKAKAKAYDLTVGSLKDSLTGLVSGFAIIGVMQRFIKETADGEYAAAQLNAVLISTKGIAQQSADALNAHAMALSRTTVFGDDLITSAQALLLTFTKIQGDTFPKATAAVLDMASAMGTDLKSAAIQVGKALNDPILGVSALGRAGVQFSESQKEVIAQLTETGRVAEAQGIILAELRTQFEGSAAAAANTLGGAIQQLVNELGILLTMSQDNSKTLVTFIKALTDVLIGLQVAIDNLTARTTAIGQFFDVIKQGAQMAMFPLTAMFALLQRGGREQREALQALSDAQTAAAAAPKSLLADAFVGVQQRQTEIQQLIQLSEVKKLDASQTKLLRDELRQLTAEMDRQGLSLQGQYEIGKRIVELQKALPAVTAKTALAAIPKLRSAIGGMVNTQTMPRIPPAMVTAIDAGTMGRVRAQMDAVAAETERMAAETTQRLQQSFAGGVIMTFADALAAGFEAALATGKISEGFKAFGSVLLQGLGGMLQQFGTAALLANKLILKLMASMVSMNPVAGIAASVALIALGGALKGAARSAFSGGGGGGGGSYSAPALGGGGSGGGGMTMPTAFFGPTAAGSANTIERINPLNVTIIGPNDPTAQRQMQELIRNADRRGNV